MADLLITYDGSGAKVDLTNAGTYNIVIPNTQKRLTLYRELDGCQSATGQELCVGLPDSTWDLQLASNFSNPALAVSDPTNAAQVSAAVADILANQPNSGGLNTVFKVDSPAGYGVLTMQGGAAASFPNSDYQAVAWMYDLRNISGYPNSTAGIGSNAADTTNKTVIATFDQIGQVDAVQVDDTRGTIFLGASNVFEYLNSSGVQMTQNQVAGPAGVSGIYKIQFSDVGTAVPTPLVTTTAPQNTTYVGGAALPGSLTAPEAGNRGKSGIGIGAMAYDSVNQILIVSLLDFGAIFTIDAQTGVVLDEWFPFTTTPANNGLELTGNDDYPQYVEGLGFNPATNEIYFWAGTSNTRGGHTGVRSILGPSTQNIYKTPMSSAGIITKPGGGVGSYTVAGTYDIGDDLIQSRDDMTTGDWVGLTTTMNFDYEGTQAYMVARSTVHQGKGWLFNVDGSGNMTLSSHVRVGNDTITGSNYRGNSHGGGGAFAAPNYTNGASGTRDSYLLIPGDDIEDQTNPDPITEYNGWGFTARPLSQPVAQPVDATPSAQALSHVFSVLETNGSGSGGQIRGVGHIAIFDGYAPGSFVSHQWQLQCDCTATQIVP